MQDPQGRLLIQAGSFVLSWGGPFQAERMGQLRLVVHGPRRLDMPFEANPTLTIDLEAGRPGADPALSEAP